MSGIAGIVSRERDPAIHDLLCRMTAAIAYRGPDERRTWVGPSVALGHTLLRATIESAHEQQPASLDGEVWITADVRLDDRSSLISRLQSEGRTALASSDDAQLILHAYHVWEEKCVAHLFGDFAFAIWDGRRRRLFCARDHFGVKPFYYARVNGALIVSNTLDCVRLHPQVRGELNDAAIRDFLAFGCNQDPTTTTFADIRRLPAAHTLTYAEDRVTLKRYWAVPTDGYVRYRSRGQYVEHFTHVLRAAVGDRMRTAPVSVWMSGGLDSTAIAAIAQQQLVSSGQGDQLRAHTIVYDTLFPDAERDYARLAAESLGIRSRFFAADDYAPFDGWHALKNLPEPSNDPFAAMRAEQLKEVAADSRVLLSGEGGDEVFWSSFLVDLVGRMPTLELGRDVLRCLIVRRRPGVGIRAKFRRIRRPPSSGACYPQWLKRNFAEPVSVGARGGDRDATEPAAAHPLRAEAHHRLSTAPWSWYFESCDAGVTRLPVEIRFPFLDLRVVKYLLAIPPLPWCVDKHLLRVAMRGRLPDRIRVRPKSALAGDPLLAHLNRGEDPWRDRFAPAHYLARCVDLAALARLRSRQESDPWQDVRPLCLNHWLKRVGNRPTLIEETS